MGETSNKFPSLHIFLSNAGGTGKTFYAALLADFLQREGHRVRCIDADPTCASLSHYSGDLDVEALPWSWEDVNIAQEAFAEVFTTGPESEIRVLDCGPAAFLPFCRFLETAQPDNWLNWWLHVPVWKGRLHSAAEGFRFLQPAMPLPLVLWLTEFTKGEATREKVLPHLPVFAEVIQALVNVPLNREQYQLLFTERRTLSALIADKSDFLRAHRGTLLLERWTPEAHALLKTAATVSE